MSISGDGGGVSGQFVRRRESAGDPRAESDDHDEGHAAGEAHPRRDQPMKLNSTEQLRFCPVFIKLEIISATSQRSIHACTCI